ncbi:1,4-alpha-glucan (glycogen) branching enzyme, GH-13-type (EC [Olavius algarvensis associated proteobacterium Delta 3]|nr:1,4-alpha-glucan (glycogen) branching enzyme, GH-13-type (EC [Olavius algarvensis associated proteobacterium Delta 3]
MIENRLKRLFLLDPYLAPYERILRRRLQMIDDRTQALTEGRMSLAEFASGHEYFGLHYRHPEWIFREWAPNAEQIFLVGDFSGWEERSDFALNRISSEGDWELRLPESRLSHKDLYHLRVHWPGGSGERIPAWTRRVVQDPDTGIFAAQIWRPPRPYVWRFPDFQAPNTPPLIYEVHVGMAQEAEGVGSYGEFTERVIPRIIDSGYNTIQLMAVQEHPYYGSFGYQVSSFFAPSSRFGPPEALKHLVDTAHGAGLRVTMDIIHSHSVSNEVEGLSRFDGTLYQYFHGGDRGRHDAWDSRCFDYGKLQVLHFLLSNCRYWLDEFHFDGFRFDGVTSMLYLHHGLGKAFTSYDDYFDATVDEDALVYLTLANGVIHQLRPDAMTIAEDVSGLPGLALPLEDGGNGFDYRFSMGVPDHWIKLTKDTRDELWSMGQLWYELTNRRHNERTISYTESHDQALVGDQTLIFRLVGADLYEHMHRADRHLNVDRGLALHKMIRLITLATAANGYLNFMGNEYGHPEWIDFPRPGNNWSYKYARRQWHLVDQPDLKYGFLGAFDRDMLALADHFRLLEDPDIHLFQAHDQDKVIIFQRAALIFIFNFHPAESYTDYRFPVSPGTYRNIFHSDADAYGGHRRLHRENRHVSLPSPERRTHQLSVYLPSRTCQVLEKIKE